MRHRLMITAAGLVASAVLSSGCLVKESHHTLALEPDGSVRWLALDRDIHAVADTAAARLREETDFMARVANERHPTAVGLLALGAVGVKTQVVSADWPFVVTTEARFDNIAELWQRFFALTGMKGSNTLTRDGNRTTWTLVVDTKEETVGTASDDERKGIESLLDGDEGPVLVIRQGRFVESVGFDIADDGRVATLDDLSERDWDKEPRLVLSLTWIRE